MATNLSLIVIKTQKLEELKEFYTALGLHFVREKHGDGPIHYSWTSPGGVVVELYPAKSADDIGRNRLEFTTHQNLDDMSNVIEREYPDIEYELLSYKHSPQSLTLHDPEGRVVEIVWKKSDSGIW